MIVFDGLFYVDALALTMICLLGFVTLVVASFSQRYLAGDNGQKAFFTRLFTLMLTISVMVTADHIFLLFIGWAGSNLVLARLMLHKSGWKAAMASSRLALINTAFGVTFLGAALLLLYRATGQTSISLMLETSIDTPYALLAGGLLILAAMSQSALWPFHRWLVSSLNSPSPVSAVMHAGLVNGGGFLLARFAPLLLEHVLLLTILVIVGIVTALLGTLWKLLQSDIKRMLACSTMGQMGFMIVQCGLGLFPAAVAHLCWHGLFKAYLFLASGAVAQEKRLDLGHSPSAVQFTLALICGAAGAYAFAFISGKPFLAQDTTVFLVIIAWMASAQFSLPVVQQQRVMAIPMALIMTTVMGGLYGLSVQLMNVVLAPLNISQPQPLNVVHIIALTGLIVCWLCMLFTRHRTFSDAIRTWQHKGYVTMLNASQPHPDTITAHHNHYQY